MKAITFKHDLKVNPLMILNTVYSMLNSGGQSLIMPPKSAGKRALFVREYLIDRNGTRAAIAAGYAPKSASVTSCRLLRNAKVQAEVAELTEDRLERLELTADTVLQ